MSYHGGSILEEDLPIYSARRSYGNRGACHISSAAAGAHYQQNKYAITTRVHREYRALREYTEFGFAHQDPKARKAPSDADMAYRCIACPYIWNVPRNYDTLPQQAKNRYFNAWTADGNFKADHTTSRQPGNNVQIFPGSGFFPDPQEFAEVTKKPMTDKDIKNPV